MDDYVPYDTEILLHEAKNTVHVKVGAVQVTAVGLAELARHLAFQMGEVRRLKAWQEAIVASNELEA